MTPIRSLKKSFSAQDFSLRGIAAVGMVAALIMSACGRDSITGPGDLTVAPRTDQLIAFRCDASPVTRTVLCAPANQGLSSVSLTDAYGKRLDALSPSGLSVSDNIIVGGSNLYVKLTSSNVAVVADTFAFNVTIQNFIPQTLGTTNGTTSDSSLSVFFSSGPTTTVGTGSVIVANPTGIATFTAPNQVYYMYGDFLPKTAISQAKRWKFRFDPTVQNFTFALYVSANVKYPDGYIDIYNPVDSVTAGGSKQLTDSVRNAIGVVNPNAGAVTWSSADSTVATINSTTGNVTGVSAGTVVVTATTGPQSGSATIVVLGTPPAAVVDSAGSNSAPGDAYHVAFDTPFTRPAPGVMSNDNRGSPLASVTSFGADSLGGTVTTNAAGSTVSPLPGHSTGSLSVAANGAVSFTPPTAFTGYYAFHYRITNTVGATPQVSDALVKIAVGVRPAASSSTYGTLIPGNTRINTDTAGGTAAAVTASGDAPTFTVTGSTGGTANIHKSKGYDFTPDVGFSGAASFTFTVRNGFGTTAPATVSLTVRPTAIWFVKESAAPGGDGRSNAPFTCLEGPKNCFSQSTNAAGAIIYVASGSYPGSATLTLKDQQQLIGQGAAGAFNTLSGIAWPVDAGAQPATGGTAPVVSVFSGTTITLGTDNTIKGLRVNSAAGGGIVGSVVGKLNVADVAIGSIGGSAIDWTSGTVNAALDSVRSTNSPTTGISLSSVAGTVTIGGGAASSITNPTGSAVSVVGGSPAFTFNGTILKTNAAGVGIFVANMSGGSASFTGPSTVLSTGASSGISIISSNAAVSFVDSVRVTTTTGNGINATNSGTLTIAGQNNSIVSVGGIALNVTSTSIGAGGLNFRSISADGGTNGIVLTSTGTTAGLTVTGDGVTSGSGGTIQNTTGADLAAAGNGVYLSSVRQINLSWMSINDHSNNGIFGTGVRGLTMNKMRFTKINGNSVNPAAGESSVNLRDLGGAVKVSNSRFDGGAYNAFRVENILGTAPVLDSLVIVNDTVGTMQGSTASPRGSAILVSVNDGTADVRIRNSYVTEWWANAIHVKIRGTASGTSRISGNFVDNTNGAVGGAGGIWVEGGNHQYNISGNTVRHTNGTAISADRTFVAGSLSGTIDNNLIGVSGDANSGTFTGIAIFATHHGTGTTTTRISNNVIRQVNGSDNGAITTEAGNKIDYGGSGTFNATIVGNDIQESGTTVNSLQDGILIRHGIRDGASPGLTQGDTDVGCYDIGGIGALRNTILNFASGTANNELSVVQRFSAISSYPGLVGSSQSNLSSYLANRNTASTNRIINSSSEVFYNTVPAGSPCPQPSF